MAFERKLTDEQRELIRWLVRVNQRELARHFGVAWITIQKLQSKTKKYGYKRVYRTKKKRSEWATRKTAPGFAVTLEKRRQNSKWLRSIEKFREYHKRSDALYHAKINGFKTHCKRRHPLTGSNVYVQVYKGRTMRRCLICVELKRKERDAKKNAIRKAYRARRRGIEVEKGVREQQGRNLRNAQQNWPDAGEQGNGKRIETSQTENQIIPVSRREENLCLNVKIY